MYGLFLIYTKLKKGKRKYESNTDRKFDSNADGA